MLAETINRFRVLRRNARLYLIANNLQAVSAGAIGVLYTLYLSSLGYGTQFIGFVVVFGAIGGGLGIIPASPLVRRLGWRAMLLWSDVIGGVAIAIQLLFPTRPVIVVTTLGIGASVALALVVNTPFLTANSTPRERTALFGLNNAIGYLAAIIGSLLGGFLPIWFAQPAIAHSAILMAVRPLLLANAQARAYELALLVTGGLALPSIIPVIFMRDADSVEGATLAQRKHKEGAVITIPMRDRLARGVAFAREIGTGVIGRFSLTQALVGLGAGLFFPFANLYFVKRLGASTAYYGIVSATLAVCIAAASLLSAPLSERFGKLRASVVAQLAGVPFLVALGLFPILGIVTVAFLLRGFLQNITSAPLQAYLMESVAPDSRVVASGVYNVSFQVAGAVGSALGGWLISVAGYRLPFLLAAPCYLLSALLLALWFGAGRRGLHKAAVETGGEASAAGQA